MRHLASCLTLVFFLLPSSVYPQTPNAVPARRALITQAVNEQERVTLHGNTRPAANAANDRGRVADSLSLEHMLLQLKRPPELEAALQQYMKEQQTPSSPNYHRWLTASEFGSRFGSAEADVNTVTNWLEAEGFVVNQVYANRLTIDFSGTAGQVRRAFQTEIHNLTVKGEPHIANMTDPQIPAALAAAVSGIVSLHDFKPHPMKTARANFAAGNGIQAVVPADLATIYQMNPLYDAGITGVNQVIAVIEDTNVYSTDDWYTFRNTFGLARYTSGALKQVHPGSCTDPGIVPGNDGEAILDAEWASASAPGAVIELASCSDTYTTFGGLIALQNLLNAPRPPAVVSISYGECEAENGQAANLSYSATYQQGAAMGVSVFVSSGDGGASGCDANSSSATHGVGVNAFASTPYNVAVGGTDFSDAYFGTTNNYWSAANSSTFGSALSYVPEIPWNDSCASAFIASYFGYQSNVNGFCNSSTGRANFLTTAAASGGPSGCATGVASMPGVVSGNCAGYSKPSWQAGMPGNPNDGVRDLPDVSLFAANGVWGHYLVYCFSDTANGGAPCGANPRAWSGGGGTSFSAPIMAGIQALIDQSTGSAWGNPNNVYYGLAQAVYNYTDGCRVNNIGTFTLCPFIDVTQGDIAVNCRGTNNCAGISGNNQNGILSAAPDSTSSVAPAYGTSIGWDFATGIGSVDAYNLVRLWFLVPPK